MSKEAEEDITLKARLVEKVGFYNLLPKSKDQNKIVLSESNEKFILDFAQEQVKEERERVFEEMLLSAICQFTKRNTQTEIQEVEKWLKTKFIK